MIEQDLDRDPEDFLADVKKGNVKDVDATDERVKRLPSWARAYIERLERAYLKDRSWILDRARADRDDVPEGHPRILVEDWDLGLPPLVIVPAVSHKVSLEYPQARTLSSGKTFRQTYRVNFSLRNQFMAGGLVTDPDNPACATKDPIWVEAGADHGRMMFIPSSSNRIEFKIED